MGHPLSGARRFAAVDWGRSARLIAGAWLAVGLGGRFELLSFEVRAAVHPEERNNEVLFLFGVTDLHGLLKRGPPRRHRAM